MRTPEDDFQEFLQDLSIVQNTARCFYEKWNEFATSHEMDYMQRAKLSQIWDQYNAWHEEVELDDIL